MKKIDEQIQEIHRLQNAINKTNSKYLKKDYSKKIGSMVNDIVEYCKYKGYDYKQVLNKIKGI